MTLFERPHTASVAAIAIFIANALISNLAFANSLEEILASLKARSAPPIYMQVSSAIYGSPKLKNRLETLASSDVFRAIVVTPPNMKPLGKMTRFGAFVDHGTIVFTTEFIGAAQNTRMYDVTYDDDIPVNNLIFVLGHLAHHVEFENKMTELMHSKGLKEYMDIALNDEAAAYIEAWNIALDGATQKNSEKALTVRQTSQLLMNERYRFAILGAANNKENTHFMQNDGSILMNLENISAVANVLKLSSVADLE